MTLKFAIRLVLLLTVLFAFNACDINNPKTDNDREVRDFIKSIRITCKSQVSTVKLYHTSMNCPEIINSEAVATTVTWAESAAEAEADGYARCTLCCDEVQYPAAVR